MKQEFLGQIAKQVAVSVDNVLAFQHIGELKNTEAIDRRGNSAPRMFKSIIVDSNALKQVLKQLEVVASADSIVLNPRETRTGKELIARVARRLSGRRDCTFVKLHCAAIPSG